MRVWRDFDQERWLLVTQKLDRRIFFRCTEPRLVPSSCNGTISPEAFASLPKQGENISESTIAHIASLGWEHVNLIGHYQFSPQKDVLSIICDRCVSIRRVKSPLLRIKALP